MKSSIFSSAALIVGIGVCTIIMLFHPAGGSPSDPEKFKHILLLNQWVHWVGLLGVPLIALGVLGVGRRLGWHNGQNLLACIFYALGLVVITFAVIASGVVGVELGYKALSGGEEVQQRMFLLATYNHTFNQACALVFAVYSGLAIGLWGLAFFQLNRVLSYLGLSVGIVIVGGILSRHINTEAHGFTIIMFLQALWLLPMGLWLIKQTRLDEQKKQGVN